MSPWKPIQVSMNGVGSGLQVWDDDAAGPPAAHAPSHTNGTDQVADATFATSGLIQGAEKEKLSSLASAIGAGLGDQLIANGGGGSIWTPPVLAMREMFTVSATDPKAEYATIHDAVDAAVAAGASATHWFLLMVFPGIYSEIKTTVPAGVVVACVSSTRSDLCDVRAFNPLDDLFILTGGYLTNLRISGVSDPLKACVRAATPGAASLIQQCRFSNCSNGLWIEAGATIYLLTASVLVSGAGQRVDRAIYVEGAGTTLVGNVYNVTVPAAVLALYPGADPVRRAIHAENGAVVNISTAIFNIAHNTAGQAAIEAGAGSSVDIFTGVFTENHLGVLINAGVGATIVTVSGSDFRNNDTNWDIQTAAGTLFFNGTVDDHNKRALVAGASECSVMQEIVNEATETYGPFLMEYLTDRTIEVTQFISERHSSVVGLGGVTIADEGGLDISVTAGKGWIHRPAAPYQDAEDVAWDHSHHTLDNNATNYIYVDSATGTITHGVAAPGAADLLLFEVLTAGGDIRFMHAVWTNGVDRCKLLEDYLRSTRRVILNTGCSATINADPHYFDLGGGSYYYGLLLETLTGGAQYPFTYYYGAGGVSTEVPAGGNHVDLLQYDNAGALAAMGAGQYRSDTLFVTSDGKVSIILGTTSNALQATAVAEAAAAAPAFLYPTVFVVAKLIVQQGAGVVQMIDLRTTATTTVAPGAADHNLLANLTAPNDAHTNYMNLSGVRPMGGDLAMGGNSITGVNLVDGVDVSAHAARHNPGGIDAIAIGLPTPIQVGDVQAAGGAASAANSAHVHAVGTGNPVAVGIANAPGASSAVPRLDHVHAPVPFTLFPLKAVAIPADVVLIEDSAAAGAKKYVTVGGLKVFGNDYVTAVAVARTTVATLAFADKVTMVTPALTGTYRVGWSAVVDTTNGNHDVSARLYDATGLAVIGVARRFRIAQTTSTLSVGGFAEVVFAGAAKTLKIQFNSPDDATVVGCQDARLEIWRVA
jgi:hypothetical protein